MDRDELLKSIGFQDKFIESLRNYELKNPEVVHPVDIDNYEHIGYFDSNKSIITLSQTNYLSKIVVANQT